MMKKRIFKQSLVAALVLLLGVTTLVGCGSDDDATDEAETEEVVEAPEESDVEEETEDVVTEEEEDEVTADDSASSDVDWRGFLAEYDALVTRALEDPLDLSILEETTEWAGRAEEVMAQLSGDELVEFSTELARIVGRLTE